MRIVFIEEVCVDNVLGICIEVGRKAVLDEGEQTVILEEVDLISLNQKIEGGDYSTLKILMLGHFSQSIIPKDSYIRLKPGF